MMTTRLIWLPFKVVLLASLAFMPSVEANSVLNGSFETGDLTSWTLSGNTGFSGVDHGTTGFAPGPQNGSFAAFFGPVGSLGFLSQNVATVSGASYDLTFRLANDGLTPNEFRVSWNGDVIFDQINPITLLEGIQKYRVSVFESVPIVFQLLLGVKNLASYDTSSVKIAAMMGTSIPLPLLRAFQSAQPHIKVIQGYGLTETSPLITLVEPNGAEAKMGSIGRAVPDVEVKIIDEAGNELGIDETQQIGAD